MADLNIPKLNKKSEKYLFKKKLSLKRKSKRRLINESIIMLILSFLFFYLNYLVPNKINLFKTFLDTFSTSLKQLLVLSSNIYQLLLVVFIFVSLFFGIILFIGSIYRIFKVLKRKTKNFNYK